MFEGLDRSEFECGYDPKFKEENTLLIIDRIKDCYINGNKQGTIAKQLHIELGMNQYTAKMLTSKAWKELVTENKKRAEGMKEKNIARLEKIYADGMATNDRKSALAAIDQLNKMTGQYKERVEVTTDEYVIDLLGGGK